MKKLLMLFCCSVILSSLSKAKTIPVKNMAELNAANQNALPGDVIELQAGKWNDCKIMLTCNGTAAQPVIFKAVSPGAVFITGKSNLRISGSYLSVEGLIFKEGSAAEGSMWEFRAGKNVANHCRISNCLVDGFNNPNRMKENYWIAFYGKNNRVDHCSFLNKTNLGVLLAVILDDDRSRLNSHSIDSNYFGLRKPLGSNGGEIIRVGVSEHCTFYSNTNIHDNFFEHCDGETEIISIKSCGNIIRNNVFKECQGAVVLRHGNNNSIEGNLFLGNGKEGTGGVRVINHGNWIVNNFFVSCRGEGFRSPLAVMNGVFNSPPNRYLPVRDAVIANNTFYNCKPFSLGEGADTERSVAPRNVYIFNNIFCNNIDKQLCYSFSELDSIYFSGNVISSTLANPLPYGFSKSKIGTQHWELSPFPVCSIVNNKSILPDSIQAQTKLRLIDGFSKKAGCFNLPHFKSLYTASGKMGCQWIDLKRVESGSRRIQVHSCKDAAALYVVLDSCLDNDIVRLTGTVYDFDKPVRIDKNLTIEGSGNNILFKSSNILDALFQLASNTRLTFNKLAIDAGSLLVKHFISADSAGECIHFSLLSANSSFANLTATSFFTAFHHAYADEIKFSNTAFISNKCNLFELKEEYDDKGFYNVETMNVNSCKFQNNSGSLLDLYRGGNDESTMGPKLFFSNNVISNCNTTGELINLYGVQQSSLVNNKFINSNPGRIVINYTDKVRASHIQQKNEFDNSGSIIENKFVINLK